MQMKEAVKAAHARDDKAEEHAFLAAARESDLRDRLGKVLQLCRLHTHTLTQKHTHTHTVGMQYVIRLIHTHTHSGRTHTHTHTHTHVCVRV